MPDVQPTRVSPYQSSPTPEPELVRHVPNNVSRQKNSSENIYVNSSDNIHNIMSSYADISRQSSHTRQRNDSDHFSWDPNSKRSNSRASGMSKHSVLDRVSVNTVTKSRYSPPQLIQFDQDQQSTGANLMSGMHRVTSFCCFMTILLSFNFTVVNLCIQI